MKEERVFGYGLCDQCGRKQPFMKRNLVRFRCDRCDLVHDLIEQLTHELHLMNRRIDKHTLFGRPIYKYATSNLLAALIEGETKWRWFK